MISDGRGRDHEASVLKMIQKVRQLHAAILKLLTVFQQRGIAADSFCAKGTGDLAHGGSFQEGLLRSTYNGLLPGSPCSMPTRRLSGGPARPG